MANDPGVADAIRHYSRRIMGEAFTQTSRALEQSEGLKAPSVATRRKQFILTLLNATGSGSTASGSNR
jgi:hypothetical protein